MEEFLQSISMRLDSQTQMLGTLNAEVIILKSTINSGLETLNAEVITLKSTVNKIDSGLEELRGDVDTKFNKIDTGLEELRDGMDTKFGEMDTKFNSVAATLRWFQEHIQSVQRGTLEALNLVAVSARSTFLPPVFGCILT